MRHAFPFLPLGALLLILTGTPLPGLPCQDGLRPDQPGALVPGAQLPSAPRPTQNRYDPAKETTFEGLVKEVKSSPLGARGLHVLSLELETPDRQTTLVHLGPERFVQFKGFRFHKGDSVRVVGARAEWGLDVFILAREVTIQNRTLQLRDVQGEPLWPGRNLGRPRR